VRTETVNKLSIIPILGTVIGTCTALNNFGKSVRNVGEIAWNTLTNLSYSPSQNVKDYVKIVNKLNRLGFDYREAIHEFTKQKSTSPQSLEYQNAESICDKIKIKLDKLKTKESRLHISMMPTTTIHQTMPAEELGQLRAARTNLNDSIEEKNPQLSENELNALLDQEDEMWGEIQKQTTHTLTEQEEILKNQILQYVETAKQKQELYHHLKFIGIGLIRAIPVVGGVGLSFYDSYQGRIRELHYL
jgi:translation elongation factor EF-G